MNKNNSNGSYLSEQNQSIESLLNNASQINENVECSLDMAHVRQIISTIDLNNTQSILNFGAQAQKQLTNIADSMLVNVSQKDLGRSGDLLNEMVSLLRGFKGQELVAQRKPSFWDKITLKAKPIENFLQRFDSVSQQLDRITNELEARKQALLIDIKSLDKLYDANLEYYYELEHHIEAAQQVLNHTDTHTLPALRQRAEQGDLQEAQKLRDRQMQRDELSHRLHDLQLTRQVAIQALPSIRLVQENDKGLVNKINSTLINTVPLWRQQLAQSIAIYRSGEAAQALKHSADLTNELLTSNAETLKIANRESREQLQRGIFDIESIEKANQTLIETIEESIAIHEKGRQHREDATKRLQQAENQLKETLKSASKQSY